MQTPFCSPFDGAMLVLAGALGLANAVTAGLDTLAALATVLAFPTLALLTVAGPRILWGTRRHDSN
jgi:hypothetical protein